MNKLSIQNKTQVSLNMDKLESLIKGLSKINYETNVGILRTKSSRSSGVANNATIGVIHELGLGDTPKRSFLSEPLEDNFKKELLKTKLFSNKNETINKLIDTKDAKFIFKTFGLIGEKVVRNAFDSGNNGQWASLDEKYMNRKKIKQILVETTQLRDSISSEVRKI